MKEQTRNTEVQINEEEIGKLLEKLFRIMVVKIIKNLEKEFRIIIVKMIKTMKTEWRRCKN